MIRGLRVNETAPEDELEPALVPVAGKADLRRFIELPRRLYADDPAWIAPLALEQRQRFSPKSPYLGHARYRAWLALANGEPVGRITAQVDNLEPEPGLGYFGMLEADAPATVARLLTAAECWLRDEGCQRVRGPLNLHINEEVGLLVDGFSTPPFMLMGHGKPWYDDAIGAAGYHGARDLLTYTTRPDFEAPAVMRRLAERAARRVTVRGLNRRHLGAEAETMRRIFNDAWSGNWGFVPLDAASWAETVSTLARLLPDDYIQFAEVDGEAVAFIVALPNLNEAARDLGGRLFPFGWFKLLWRLKVQGLGSARIPLMGVTRAYQHSRLGPTLAFMVIDAVREALHRRGVTEVEMGWILEDNAGMRNIIETIGGRAYKRYRVYEKDL
jgi:GNAT superfamily N-acetyltransferase